MREESFRLPITLSPHRVQYLFRHLVHCGHHFIAQLQVNRGEDIVQLVFLAHADYRRRDKVMLFLPSSRQRHWRHARLLPKRDDPHRAFERAGARKTLCHFDLARSGHFEIAGEKRAFRACAVEIFAR